MTWFGQGGKTEEAGVPTTERFLKRANNGFNTGV